MNPSSSAATGASSSTAPPPPAPLPHHPPQRPEFYPRVRRSGMAADLSAVERPVRVVDSQDWYLVRIQVPCPVEALVTVTTGRISRNRGMSIHARVSWSQMRTAGSAFVYRPGGSHRVHGGGEYFRMQFDLPGRVRRIPDMPWRVDRHRSLLVFRVRKVPAIDPDEPEDLASDYRTVHYRED